MVDKERIIQKNLWSILYRGIYLKYLITIEVIKKNWCRTIRLFLAKSSYRSISQKTDNSWTIGFYGISHHPHESKTKVRDFSFLWKIFIKKIILNS
ncbi:MAG: hypothetical protein QCI00_06450 [Candidatus Thermoplasmatota archaeon]|nr:hypothetical protein [Candidatus Thermoplasmatota archaeon]